MFLNYLVVYLGMEKIVLEKLEKKLLKEEQCLLEIAKEQRVAGRNKTPDSKVTWEEFIRPFAAKRRHILMKMKVLKELIKEIKEEV